MAPISTPRSRGFTLIELITVIALIGILTGITIGLTRLSKSPNSALKASQSVLNSLVTAARAQAATNGAEVILYVANDPARPDRYLRHFTLAVEVLTEEVNDVTDSSKRFRAIGDGVLLPEGVYVVPPSVDATLSGGANWTSPDVRSTALGITVRLAPEPPVLPGAPPGPELGIGMSFLPGGTTGQTGNIVLAEGLGSGANLTLQNPAGVRGILLNQYGFTLLANSPSSF